MKSVWSSSVYMYLSLSLSLSLSLNHNKWIESIFKRFYYVSNQHLDYKLPSGHKTKPKIQGKQRSHRSSILTIYTEKRRANHYIQYCSTDSKHVWTW